MATQVFFSKSPSAIHALDKCKCGLTRNDLCLGRDCNKCGRFGWERIREKERFPYYDEDERER